MPFLRANIDRVIVMTQYDLRGFAHPVGTRIPAPNPKSLDAITGNLAAGAAGFGQGPESESTDQSYVNYFQGTPDEYLIMCRQLYADCDDSQREAIQLIVLEIFNQSERMKAEVAEKTREPSHYLLPLEDSNRWGKAMLALAEVFQVNLEPVMLA